MLVKDSEALERLGSPLNLMNRMRGTSSRSGAMSLFVRKRGENNEELKNKDENNEVAVRPVVQTPQFTNPFSAETTNQPTATSPTINNLIDNAESQIELANAHNNALDLLNNAVSTLRIKLDDVKPEKLPSVIAAASRVVDGIRRERNEATKNSSNRTTNIIFYTPQQRQISEYNVIEVN